MESVLKIVFSYSEGEELKSLGYRDVACGKSTDNMEGYYYVVTGRYDHDSKYPNLTISVPAAHLDKLAAKCGVSIPATRYNKTYPGEMGARGQYYAPVEGAAYRFYVPA